MMEFSGNIVISAFAHAAFFMTALALAGGNTISRLPEKYVAVTLLEDPAGNRQATASIAQKGPVPKKEKSHARLSEVAGPEASLATEKKAIPAAAAPTEKIRPLQEDEGPAGAGPSEKGTSAPREQTREVGNFPGASPAKAVQLSLPGKAATRGGMEGGGKGTAAGNAGPIDAIRSAIEKAKSYPPLARKRGIEGTVTAEFTIGPRGYPEHVRIVHSSGYEILDSAAKRTILRASPFPAVNGTLEVPITFRLDR